MRAIETTDLLELQVWCQKYEAWTPYSSNILERFLIGMYQIPGNADWGESHLNKWESLASAAVHFIMVAERMNIHVESVIDRDLLVIQTRPFHAEFVLRLLCKAAQQLTYGNPRNKTQRAKNRYDTNKLLNNLGAVVVSLLGAIPSHARGIAIQDATLIMTGKL